MVGRGAVIVAQVECTASHDRRQPTKALLSIDTLTIPPVDEPNPHSGEIEHHQRQSQEDSNHQHLTQTGAIKAGAVLHQFQQVHSSTPVETTAT
jgi:hypothetical protein